MMGTFEPGGDRRPPITPQMALRVAVFGAIALGLFAIIFFRLWYLQVLSGDEYLAEANSNRVRELRIQAPRGEIVDRKGKVIVENRRAVVVTMDPAKLPDEERELAATWGQDVTTRARKPKGQRGEPVKIPPTATDDLRRRYIRLGKALNMRAGDIHRQVVRSLAIVPYSAIRVKTDIPQSVLSYLAERPQLFPGVQVEETFLRRYPQKELAAQVLGSVNEISPKQLKEERFRGVTQGTIIGQSGLEYEYDRYLRGRDGIERVQVDAFGRPISTTTLRRREPEGGQQLKLSLDSQLQDVGQKAFSGQVTSLPGAFIAMDPRNGEVLAMGSNPTFDPAVLTKPMTPEQYEQRFGDKVGAPLFNRAVQGLYPTASTFKAITAMAGLESGTITPESAVADAGCTKVGTQEFCNAGKEAYGTVDLRKAIQVSSDVYFYRLGANLFLKPNQVLQRWARRLGLGRRTGIDLPGEFRGLIPDRRWRERINKKEVACRKKTGKAYCGFAFGEIRPYLQGDNVQLAIGQGDVQATPLQMATAYSAIANGGRVPTPHLGLEIEDGQGRLIQRIERPASRRVRFNAANRQAVMDGLRLAAEESPGTSADVFKGWPHKQFPVFGKTGTAERPGQADQSWYVAYVPSKDRPIVVAVTVEKGGFGAETAAPIARLMLAQWFGQEKKVVRGDDTSN